MTEEEAWKRIAGYEGFYAVSNRGRIWAFERWIVRIHTRPYLQKAGLIAPRVGNGHGHLAVTLYDEHGQRRKFWVHRLVAEMWIPNPNKLPFVLHGLEGPATNHVGNLRWGDHSENELDKARHRLARQQQREDSM